MTTPTHTIPANRPVAARWPAACGSSKDPGTQCTSIASGASRVTDAMFMAAAHTLAEQVSEDDLRQGSLYPPLKSIREVSAHIAAAVAEVAYRRELAQGMKPADLLAFVKSQMYEPCYPTYVAG